MNPLEKTSQKIVDAGIDILELQTQEVKCATVKYNSDVCIFLDNSKFLNSQEKRTALEHEYYHAINNLFYGFDDKLRFRKRQEFKANFEMGKELVPVDELKTLIISNYNIYEMSDYFNLDESYIKEIIRIYKSKGMI